MKNIDKIVPISAITLSMSCALFVVNHFLQAESYSGYFKVAGDEEFYNPDSDFNIGQLEIVHDDETITLSAFLDLEMLSEDIEISQERILETYDQILNKEELKSDDLRQKYKDAQKKRNNLGNIQNKNLKILIVPGHDQESTGAIFRDLKESQLNIELAQKLEKYLNHQSGIEVTLARDEDRYLQALNDYFSDSRSEIQEFIFNHKIATQKMIKDDLYQANQIINHNHAEFDVASRLYGINQWANNENFDLTIHIHFNDYPRSNHSVKGEYSGFSIYVPEKQFSHSESSIELAQNINDVLQDYFLPSNLPMESDIIIETQDLIAIGANHTINYPSILIEYDYLYEDQFQTAEIRKKIIDEKAYRTYLGIMKFLNPKIDFSDDTSSLTNLIHNLEEDLWLGQKNSKDVMSLQAFLKREGYFDFESTGVKNTNQNIKEKNINQRCPINGHFNLCTQQAVKEFQTEHDLRSGGFVGKRTRELINGLI